MSDEPFLPRWYPLEISAPDRCEVIDKDGNHFARGCDLEAAALIVLILNDRARRDFELENEL